MLTIVNQRSMAEEGKEGQEGEGIKFMKGELEDPGMHTVLSPLDRFR